MAKTTKMEVYFPEEIILKILHKLPVKSLFRFTCVCKSWLSLITSPTFISTHLDLTISSPTKNPLLLLRFCSKQNNNHTEHYSLRSDDQNFNHYMHLHLPFKPRYPYRSPYFRLVGTINGLICLLDRTTHTIILWNPLIRKSVSLPKPTITGINKEVSFGFDSRTHDYKVLRVVEMRRNNLEAEVYSLNTNAWKRVGGGGGVPRYEIKWSEKQVFVNGVVHFLASKRVSGVKCHNLILGFDMGDEVFREIQLPQTLVNEWRPYLNVLACDELIAVFQEHSLVPGGGRHVWVMEEYGVVQSWTRIFSFDGLASVLGFRKNRDLFLELYSQEIVSFDAKSRNIKHFGVRGNRGVAFVDYFVESMELINNANAVSDANFE